ncbi:MAG TPA: SdrD B-like domain-containing protein [Candidatus Paceibacterota bacterium]|nr:SdrD B-like domain-containing protein [Candidatus Paceibacterota bacterium]
MNSKILSSSQLLTLSVIAVLSLGAISFVAMPAHADTGRVAVTSTTGSSTISGTIFTDTNHNKVQDNGESGIAGLLVWLHLGGHGKNAVVATTTTDSLGHYVFSNLASGTYFVTQKVKGFFHFDHKAQQTKKVTLTATTTAATVNFADRANATTTNMGKGQGHDKNDNDNDGDDKAKFASTTKMVNIKAAINADLHSILKGDNGKHGNDDNDK